MTNIGGRDGVKKKKHLPLVVVGVATSLWGWSLHKGRANSHVHRLKVAVSYFSASNYINDVAGSDGRLPFPRQMMTTSSLPSLGLPMSSGVSHSFLDLKVGHRCCRLLFDAICMPFTFSLNMSSEEATTFP